MDVRGNRYEKSSFLVPELKLGELSLTDVEATEVCESYFSNTLIAGNLGNSQIYQGILGLDAFKGKNLLFDFAHSSLIVCDDKKVLEIHGYPLNSMAQGPFELFEKRIVVVVQTDIGPLKLMVDSGASGIVIKESLLKDKSCPKGTCGLPQCTTSTFVINGKDFGLQHLFLWDFPKEFSGIDGLLGMDFLLEHQMYIDQQNKVLYIN